jgi:hypothetical protein
MDECSERMLVESGRGASRTGSSNDRGREINVDSFFNPNGFAIVDLLPQGDRFTAQYFIDQILKPLGQEHSTKSAHIARRSLRLHFDNSRCYPAKIVDWLIITLGLADLSLCTCAHEQKRLSRRDD